MLPEGALAPPRASARGPQQHEETAMSIVQPSSKAPEFSLNSHTDKKLALADFRGRATVVSFLPFAFTGG